VKHPKQKKFKQKIINKTSQMNHK
jgi:hypothetical protein